MGTANFSEELNFFISNQENLVKEFFGKVLVLKGKKVIGVYPNALSAYIETQKKHPPGTFMIQPCVPGPEAYTVTITSTALMF
ncbi:MAG: hypothetical protein WBW55_12165 [Desulfobaccales bacterium]